MNFWAMFIFNIVLIIHQRQLLDLNSKAFEFELGLVWIQVDQGHDHIAFNNGKGEFEFELT